MDSFVDLSGVSVSDERSHCPICFESAPFAKGLENHLAHHLERFAMFALPRLAQDGASTTDRPDSQRMGEGSLNSGRSLGPPVFSDRGAPNSATSEQEATPRKPETLSPRPLGSATPTSYDFRYKVLHLLHEQLHRLNEELKNDIDDDEGTLVLSPQELVWLALDEEQKIATENLSDPSIYENVIKNRIIAYHQMTSNQWLDELTDHKMSSHSHSIHSAGDGEGSQQRPVDGTQEQRRPIIDRLKAALRRNKHNNLVQYMVNAASEHGEQLRWGKATLLLLLAIKEQIASFGVDHSFTRSTIVKLAQTYGNRRLWAEAGNLWARLVQIGKRKLGDQHPNTVAYMRCLAVAYVNQERWEEAESLWKEIIETQTEIWGKDDGETLQSLAQLALLYKTLDRQEESDTLISEIKALYLQTSRPYDDETVEELLKLASLFLAQDRSEEAERLLEWVLEVNRRLRGERHVDTLSAMQKMTAFWHEQGRLDKASDLMQEIDQIEAETVSRDNFVSFSD
jgi:tetratricopeptide (TPR) repeat protein